MANPTPYEPSYDFAATDKGASLNVELQNISGAMADVITALADVRREDGKLKNYLVGADALDPMVLTQFSEINMNLAGVLADTVAATQASANAAADQAIAANVSNVNALQAVADAAAQAQEAAASAVAAATSVTAAAASATAAATSATAASGSASSASTSAAAAASSAANAATALANSRFAFSARKSADQTGVVTGTATKVTFPTEVFDFGGYFDAANSRFVPPSGRYRLSAGLGWSTGIVDGRQVTVEIWKNGAAYRVFGVQVSGTTDNALVSGDCLAGANGTDYFEVYATGWGVNNKTVVSAASVTYFEGEAL
jgi:hypothetical protein